MKAFLLAAGTGTRLRPITNSIPKCLVQICNKTLLGWWIELLQKHNVDEVLINLHHFPEKVISYLNSNSGGIKFNYFFEKSLLGSAGTLKKNKDFVKDEKSFYILYADNLTNVNLSKLFNYHESHKNPFTMALFETNNPSSCGIVMVNEENVIVDFEEKPQVPKSNLASAGIFVSEPDIIDLIPDKNVADIGFDLVPKLVNKMNGILINDFLIDIGTHDNLKKAEIEWNKIINNNRSSL